MNPQTVPCPTCNGEDSACTFCDGVGVVCSTCDGAGFDYKTIEQDTCTDCGGKGHP